MFKRYINQLLVDVNDIIPVGHHHLGRHHVFYVKCIKDDYIIKFFGKPHKYNREKYALSLLKSSKFMTPVIMSEGIIENHEYIVMSNIKGIVLTEVQSIKIKYQILYETGQQLALIHKNHEFDYFGIIGNNDQFIIKSDQWINVYKEEISRHLRNIKKTKHPNQQLINDSLAKLVELLPTLQHEHKGYLTHNDIGCRNILVNENHLSGIIDFEQSGIMDRYREIIIIKYRLDLIDNTLFEYFLNGYTKVFDISASTLRERSRLYLLHHGLMICSWSLEVDRKHYDEGVALLQKLMHLKN